MCPHTPTYLASSRSNKRVLVLLYTCPHTPTRRHHPAHRARAMHARLQLGKAPQPHRNIFSKLKKKPACGSKRTSQPHRIAYILSSSSARQRAAAAASQSRRERVNEPSTCGSKLNSWTAGARLQLDEEPQPHLKVQGMPDARKAAKALVRFVVSRLVYQIFGLVSAACGSSLTKPLSLF